MVSLLIANLLVSHHIPEVDKLSLLGFFPQFLELLSRPFFLQCFIVLFVAAVSKSGDPVLPIFEANAVLMPTSPVRFVLNLFP